MSGRPTSAYELGAANSLQFHSPGRRQPITATTSSHSSANIPGWLLLISSLPVFRIADLDARETQLADHTHTHSLPLSFSSVAKLSGAYFRNAVVAAAPGQLSGERIDWRSLSATYGTHAV